MYNMHIAGMNICLCSYIAAAAGSGDSQSTALKGAAYMLCTFLFLLEK